MVVFAVRFPIFWNIENPKPSFSSSSSHNTARARVRRLLEPILEMKFYRPQARRRSTVFAKAFLKQVHFYKSRLV